MFTADQIKAAHSKVKSGAEFPAYIQEIKAMGVTHYECYVSDGRIDYHGANDHTATVPAKYTPLTIASSPDPAQFISGLKAHQRGETDFIEFINMCAETGVEKWEVAMDKMTCTYFDKDENEILIEKIPG